MLIIDIGGGLYRDYVRKLVNNKNLTILSFEPHPTLYNKILKETNNIGLSSRLKIHNKAVVPTYDNNTILYLVNDDCASSTNKLKDSGSKKWKYPLSRRRFHTIGEKVVDAVNLESILRSNEYKNSLIDVLHLDIVSGSIAILKSISGNTYKRIKRIIIKVVISQTILYEDQSLLEDIIDIIRVKGYVVINAIEYSRGQEQYVEFLKCDTQDKRSIMKLNAEGVISIE
jgi:FkbM family methyltransferase